MFIAPLGAVSIADPLLVDIQQCQVVALRRVELFPGSVAFLGAIFRPEKDRRHGQHRDDGHHLSTATQVLSRDEHFRQGWVQRELRHLVPEGRDVAEVVQGSEHPELEQGVQNRVLRRRVHEAKLQQILHPHRLQQQHHIREVRALNLRNGHWQQLGQEGAFRVQSPTTPRASPSSSAATLVRVGLRDGRHLQAIHAHFGVVELKLAIPRVDNILDAVDCQRCLGDVGRNDALPLLARLKDLGLEVGGQL
mmetsp:Transcript_98828/g.283949  ORF Transcript_98828/g.283949 Transcript_98828/m.283949 type:complete len:250 (-) Transcript_98828:490-1239(-)